MRNHYIQKQFIETFCGVNGIMVYDILEDRILPKFDTANGFALENDLYHFKNFDYPDAQIENDLKKVEDKGMVIIRNIISTEELPSQDNLYVLFTYLYYQSKRLPLQKELLQEDVRKLNKICKTSIFDDWFLFDMYNDNASESIVTLVNEYNIYLLKLQEPLFFITDCYCAMLQSKGEHVIPLTSNLALYLIPRNKIPSLPLSLKKNIANMITDNDFICMMPFFGLYYKRFAFTSYTDTNYTLLPKLFKILQKYLDSSR